MSASPAMVASGQRSIRGVLFDIDDTLVDLRSAMNLAVRLASEEYLPALSEEGWEQIQLNFHTDPGGYYDAFLAGELDFVQQRLARARQAFAVVGGKLPEDRLLDWNASYESAAQRHWRPFDDVAPTLAVLDQAGISYGAVSNNVEAYQRRKLDIAGLAGISVLIGTDTVGVPKPEAAIFHEGARQLGPEADQVLYVGDNLMIDAVGASSAGLPAVWLNRAGVNPETGAWQGLTISSLTGILRLLDGGLGTPGD
ncbi:HAD family hydrolase [Psychromicrobium xiongbiense]|uniref:HAD family hydrolase n=1 Tax=Psychromicrobium xiongbiense TaxID=3051184 RepID=UPI0025533C5A|nr:HAD family hydrolase [Psychromicrobium sp. YIM S02556]